MAKNEAKIKFTAETGSFNDAIKKANSEMTQLRAELKLNDAQMKSNGTSVEALENKHRILTSQLAVSESKTEALSQKVNKAAELFGENSTEVTKLKTQLLNAQTAEEKIRQAISDCNDELLQQKESANRAETATERLTNTISKQQFELDKLKKDYSDAVLAYGEASDEAKSLEDAIGKVSSELKQNKTALSDAADKADELDQSLKDVDESADDAGDGFTVLKGTVADLASNAIQEAISKISDFMGYLAELPEATREMRQDMATLNTSFDNMGFSVDTAKNTWKDLYAVFGEDDRAVEASNLIAQMSDDQQDLNDWVTITTGIWGTYQDSLPVEGLAEAAMETAKTGAVTGVFADALNWSSEAAVMFSKYMSKDVVTAEDAFNVALSKCSTEQERQQLITDTLMQLYGEAAGTYRDVAGAQLEAKEAAAEQMLVENDLAAAIEPVTTAWTEMKTTLLNELKPAVEAITGVMTGALSWMQEHPAAVKAIAAAAAVLAVGLGGLATAWGIYTIAQWAANSAMLVPAAICLGIVAAIAAVVAIIVLLVENWDIVKAKCFEIWEAIKVKCSEIWEGIKTFLSQTWEDIKTAVSTAWDTITNAISTALDTILTSATTVWNDIKTAITTVVDAIRDTISAAWDTITSTTSSIMEGIKGTITGAWDAVRTSVTDAISSVQSTISTGLDSAMTTVSGILDSIQSKFSSIFKGAKDIVTGAISEIQNAFNFDWSLPKLKLPHVKISGSFSLSPPSVPKFSVVWYKDGGIFTKPTIFSTPYGFKGVGEAGAEAVLPIEKLQVYIYEAIERVLNAINLQALANAIEALASRPVELNINGRQFAVATAGDSDSVSGLRSSFKSRGLIVE